MQRTRKLLSILLSLTLIVALFSPLGASSVHAAQKIEDVIINISGDTSIRDFNYILNRINKTKVTLNNGEVKEVPVDPATRYATLADQFADTYPDYMPYRDYEQTFTLVGNVDLHDYDDTESSINPVNIRIIVAPGTKYEVKYANPGTIKLQHGTTKDAFKKALETTIDTVVYLNHSAAPRVYIEPGYKDKDKKIQYSSYYEQYLAECKPYEPEELSQQIFTITGLVDLSRYEIEEKYEVEIVIIVSAKDRITVLSVDDVVINIPNGVTLEEFATYLEQKQVCVIHLSDGTDIQREVYPETYKTFREEYYVKYPISDPTNTYDPTNKNAQVYYLNGIVDLTKYEDLPRHPVNIVVKVAAREIKTVSKCEFTITIGNDVTLQTFVETLCKTYTVTAQYTDNTIGYGILTPGFNSQNKQYENLYAQFVTLYGPYEQNITEPKMYKMVGIVDLTSTKGPEEARVDITINITKGSAITVNKVEDVLIQLPAGTSLESFIEYLNIPHTATVVLSNNTTTTVQVLPGINPKTQNHYSSFYEQFQASGWSYNPSSTTTQTFTMWCDADLSAYNYLTTKNVKMIITVGTQTKVSSFEHINISIENGTDLTKFKGILNSTHKSVVKLTDGTTVNLAVAPGYRTNGIQYTSFYEQFTAEYPGNKGYDPNNKNAQSYVIYGNLDLSNYNGNSRNQVKITIQVSKGATVNTISDLEINITSGTTLDYFIGILNKPYNVDVRLSDSTTVQVPVKPGYINATNLQYNSLYDQFTAMYPAGYDPNNKNAQTYIMYGNVDLSKYGGNNRNEVLIKINVGSTDDCMVTFNANGGVYEGSLTMVVRAGSEYGFVYIPSELYREDYLFNGWYTEPDGGTRVYSTSICTGDITLYAHWLKVYTGMSWYLEAKSWGRGRLTVKWDRILTKVNGYEVAISTDKRSWSISVGPIGRVKYYKGLRSRKTYYVKVRGWRYDSTGKKIYGAWSAIASGRVR